MPRPASLTHSSIASPARAADTRTCVVGAQTQRVVEQFGQEVDDVAGGRAVTVLSGRPVIWTRR